MDYTDKRKSMVKDQLIRRGISDQLILNAFRNVKREVFVVEAMIESAYDDCALPLFNGQTISQPYIVALSCELAELVPGSKVLEIGMGSGYEAAILSEITSQVFSVEYRQDLYDFGRNNLDREGYSNVVSKCFNGWYGWQDHAPFNAIIVAAAAKTFPKYLAEELDMHGSLIIPIEKDGMQFLTKIKKTVMMIFRNRRYVR